MVRDLLDWETIGAQLLAGAFVVGSYFARRVRQGHAARRAAASSRPSAPTLRRPSRPWPRSSPGRVVAVVRWLGRSALVAFGEGEGEPFAPERAPLLRIIRSLGAHAALARRARLPQSKSLRLAAHATTGTVPGVAPSQRTEPPSHARATDKRVRHAPFCQPGAWGPPPRPAQPSPRRPNHATRHRKHDALAAAASHPKRHVRFRGSAEPRRSDMSDEPSDRWKVRQPRAPSCATPPAPPSPSPTKPGGAPPKRDERNATASHPKRNVGTTARPWPRPPARPRRRAG